MKRSLLVLVCLALRATSCNVTEMTTVAVSGRVVAEGDGRPLAIGPKDARPPD